MAEPSTSFEDAWERFQALESLRLADETEWTHGRAQFLTCLVRMEDRAVYTYAHRVIERIAGCPGVEPFPEEYWHLTVKQIGFQVVERTREDEVLRQDVSRLAREMRRVLSSERAYDARLAQPNAFPDAVVLEVQDDGRTRELNRALAEQLPDVVRYPTDGGAFLPHMSIARFSSSEGLDELKSTLAELRKEAPGHSFQVRRVDFIKAWLSDETPEFETLASVPLAAP